MTSHTFEDPRFSDDSCGVDLNDESYELGIEVFDWYLQVPESDSNLYSNSQQTLKNQSQYADNHIFSIRVWVNQHMYIISRTYSAFCKLYLLLNKHFPRSKLPNLPLNANLKLFLPKKSSPKQKQSNIDEVMTTRISMVTTGRESLFASDFNESFRSSNIADDESEISQNSFGRGSSLTGFSQVVGSPAPTSTASSIKTKKRRLIGKNEVVSQKKQALTNYLNKLKDIPEIAVSEVFISFLDEAYIDGFSSTLHHRNRVKASSSALASSSHNDIIDLDFIDILLADIEMTSKVVIRKCIATENVNRKSVIIWKFSTKNYDIGFNIKLDSKEVLTYQRYNSHIEPIKGYLEISEFFPPSNNKNDEKPLVIKWDNKYSLMRSKQLSYCYKICSFVEVETAKEICHKINSETQRHLFQRQLIIEALKMNSKLYPRSSLLPNPSLSSFGLVPTSTSFAGIVNSNSGGKKSNSNHSKMDIISALTAASSSTNQSSLVVATTTPQSLIMPSSVNSILDDSELLTLQGEHRLLKEKLANYETELVNERIAFSQLNITIDEIINEKDKALNEIAYLSTQLGDLSVKFEDLTYSSSKRINELEQQLKQANEQIASLTSTMFNKTIIGNSSNVSTSVSNSNAAAEESATLAKLKLEKKQLRAYALERKTEAEKLLAENEILKNEIQRLSVESTNINNSNGFSHLTQVPRSLNTAEGRVEFTSDRKDMLASPNPTASQSAEHLLVTTPVKLTANENGVQSFRLPQKSQVTSSSTKASLVAADAGSITNANNVRPKILF